MWAAEAAGWYVKSVDLSSSMMVPLSVRMDRRREEQIQGASANECAAFESRKAFAGVAGASLRLDRTYIGASSAAREISACSISQDRRRAGRKGKGPVRCLKARRSKELLERVAMVRTSGAVRSGQHCEKRIVTTEEINHADMTTRRAAQDAKDLGFRLKRVTVKHTNGRSIAAYVLTKVSLTKQADGGRSEKERDAIIHAAGDRCQICPATTICR